MITTFQIFEKQKVKRPKIKIDWVSPQFWDMVKIVGWSKIPRWTGRGDVHPSDVAKKILITNYPLVKIKEFEEEYRKLHKELQQYFWPLCKKGWLGVSDDGYDDLISSVIGAGKTFTKACMTDDKLLIEFYTDNKYKENFGYIFHMDDYWKIVKEVDPIRLDSEKFGI